MKEILAQFGTAILAATITGALLLLIMTLHSLDNSGLGGGIGTLYSETTGQSLKDSYSGKTFEKYKENSGIRIETTDCGPLIAGREFALSEWVTAKDAKENTVGLKALRIEDEDGNVYSSEERDGECYVCLEKAGFYTFWLAGEDANGVIRRGVVKIPVQAG